MLLYIGFKKERIRKAECVWCFYGGVGSRLRSVAEGLCKAYRRWRVWRRADEVDKGLLKAAVEYTEGGRA